MVTIYVEKHSLIRYVFEIFFFPRMVILYIEYSKEIVSKLTKIIFSILISTYFINKTKNDTIENNKN